MWSICWRKRTKPAQERSQVSQWATVNKATEEELWRNLGAHATRWPRYGTQNYTQVSNCPLFFVLFWPNPSFISPLPFPECFLGPLHIECMQYAFWSLEGLAAKSFLKSQRRFECELLKNIMTIKNMWTHSMNEIHFQIPKSMAECMV